MAYNRTLATSAIIGAATALFLAGMMNSSKLVGAQQETSSQTEESRIRRGFEIAPVPLNLEGKNRALVGLGSYVVNAVGDCNGCHSAGPRTEFTGNGNPYQLSPPFSGKKQINTANYLGGGGFWPIWGTSTNSAPLLPQFDPGQNRLASGRTHIRRVRRDHEARHRSRSRTPKLHSSRHACQLSCATLQRRLAPGNAMAVFQRHDRSRSPSHLRVSECGPLQSG